MNYTLSNRVGESIKITNANTQPTQNVEVNQQIRQVMIGEILQGEVLSIQGQDVTLALDKNFLFQAKVDAKFLIAQGQILSFEVKGGNKNQIFLSPLFSNMAKSPTVEKALQEAGILSNDKNAAMVETLMKQGLPIDKETLYQMLRYSNTFQDLPLATLTQMVKYQIPINEDNIKQWNAYQNMEHQVVQGMEVVADEIPKMLDELLIQGKTTESLDFVKELSHTFWKPEGMDEMNPESKMKALVQEMLGKEVVPKENIQDTVFQKYPLTKGEQEQVVRFLEQAGVSKEVTEGVAKGLEQGATNNKEVLQLLNSVLEWKSESIGKESIHKLMQGEGFAKLIKNTLMDQWLLAPKDLEKQNSIEELYQRIREQTTKLTESLSGVVREDSGVMKAANSLKGNVEFMNQLNQMFNYIQIPLKLGNRQANGELYVYTNKKNLAKKDGNVSALLHLDMENLGTLDVYVAMQVGRVSTKFYLEKEAYMDFLEEHMDLLTERLQKRGYDVSTQVLRRESIKDGTTVEEHGVLQNLKEGNAQNRLIGNFAFDVRA